MSLDFACWQDLNLNVRFGHKCDIRRHLNVYPKLGSELTNSFRLIRHNLSKAKTNLQIRLAPRENAQ